MRRLAFVLLFFVAFVACDEPQGNTHAPSMENHRFTPETLTISTGETIRWVNDTDEAHTVTAVEDSLPDGAAYFASGEASDEDAAVDSLSDGLIQPGDAFEWTFEEAGTYRYYCIPHRGDGMEGTIEVE